MATVDSPAAYTCALTGERAPMKLSAYVFVTVLFVMQDRREGISDNKPANTTRVRMFLFQWLEFLCILIIFTIHKSRDAIFDDMR